MHRCDLDRDSWKKKYDHQEDFHFLLASQSTVFPSSDTLRWLPSIQSRLPYSSKVFIWCRSIEVDYYSKP